MSSNKHQKAKERPTGNGFTKAGRNSRSGGQHRGKNRPLTISTAPTSVATLPANTHKEQLHDRLVASFTPRFNAAVEKAIGSSNWAESSARLARQYAQALVLGDGLLPEGLNPGRVADTVQQRFALSCYLCGIGAESFPGQLQDWYPTRYNEAATYWSQSHK